MANIGDRHYGGPFRAVVEGITKSPKINSERQPCGGVAKKAASKITLHMYLSPTMSHKRWVGQAPRRTLL